MIKLLKLSFICLVMLLITAQLFGCSKTPNLTAPEEDAEAVSSEFLSRSVFGVLAEINGESKDVVMTSDGSGVIAEITSKGAYVVTNFHVIFDPLALESDEKFADRITVFPYGADAESGISAECIYYSAEYDVAVLYVADILSAFPFATSVNFASREARLAESILVLGNTGGCGISAKSGCVSRPEEKVLVPVTSSTDAVDMWLIRIDAEVGTGDSGGALFSENGELLGIVNAKRQDDLGAYAIPSSVVKPIIDQIIDLHKKGNEPKAFKLYSGLSLKDVYSGACIDEKNGAMTPLYDVTVTDVKVGSIGSVFFEEGNVIRSAVLNGTEYKFTSEFDFYRFLLCVREGDRVTFSFNDEGRINERSFTVTLPHLTEIH